MTSHESGLGSASAYVPASEVGGFVILDEGQRAALEHWTARLIPGDREWPDARQVEAAAYIDAVLAAEPVASRVVTALARLEAAAAELCSAPFSDCPPRSQDQLLEELSRDPASADAFTQVLELTYEAYYRDPAVCDVMTRRTGFDSALPHLGSEMEPFDEALLDRVRRLSPRYREAEG
jgi:hypothetical protein